MNLWYCVMCRRLVYIVYTQAAHERMRKKAAKRFKNVIKCQPQMKNNNAFNFCKS